MKIEKIDTVVFTKDRPLQLYAYLESYYQNVYEDSQGQLVVFYRTSDEKYEDGYRIIRNEFKKVTWVYQNKFDDQLKEIVNNFTSKHILVTCDDDIWVNNFKYTEHINKIFNHNVATLMLHLRPALDFCYPMNAPMQSPDYIDNYRGLMLWNWTKADKDYGYPMGVSCSMWGRESLLTEMNKYTFAHPNELEEKMSQNPFTHRPFMLSFRQNKMINSPLNRVQDYSRNPNANISTESLNQKFLEGYKIDLTKIDKSPNMAAKPIDLYFTKRK